MIFLNKHKFQFVSNIHNNIPWKKNLNEIFVDKSLFLTDVLLRKDKIILISRPNNWGKKTIRKMLNNFFYLFVIRMIYHFMT